MIKYAPIHNHTEYSALDGLSKCREVMQRCQDIGVTHVGISDHGTVAGHLEFAKEAAAHDIQPVFGCELYHGVKTEFSKNERDQAHFIAGALTDEGLRNLWRLVDAASTNFRYVGRVNWEMLEAHSEGLFATSACIQGLVGQAVMDETSLEPLERYLDIFGENFYIELHTYPGDDHEYLNTTLVDLAEERGLPVIYATDAHFASPDQYEVHDAFVAKQTGDSALMPKSQRSMWHPKCLYIQDADEIAANLSYLPEGIVQEALTNSAELAERCNASLPEVRRHLPAFIPKQSPWVEDPEMTTSELFLQEIEKGIEERYGPNVPDEVWGRAMRELEVFLDAGLDHFFLQAWDVKQFFDAENIKQGPGRGSVGGTIVAYALGISDVDPLEHDLIFERFYNPGREKGYPDIDTDIPTRYRKKVKEYLERRWGKDNVRAIGTVRRMKPKHAVDLTAKTFNIDFETKEQLKDLLDNVPDIDILGADSIGWDMENDPGKTIYVMHPTAQANHDTGRQIKKWVQSLSDDGLRSRVLRWLNFLSVACSRIDGYGIHPSGIVVSDTPLAAELPSMWNTEQKTQVTCFNMEDVDARMFVKLDYLGLANLDILDEWEMLVEPYVGAIDWKAVERDHNEAMWDLFAEGNTLGIFQINDGYARHLCKKFKPRSIADLAVIISLNRPGPIRSGAPESFIARRLGEEEITYDHPILEDILESTYGWFLYQEQVIRFFGKLGYSLSEGDAVRKILGKKKPEQMQALYKGEGEWVDRGYMEMAQKVGIAEEIAKLIWEKLEDFAKYSFNKSHAIEYATLGFRTAFAKFNALALFYVACIRVFNDQKKKKTFIGKYITEARRKGINVATPDILTSSVMIAESDGEVQYGLADVKYVGKGAAEYIIWLRDRYDISSFDGLHEAIASEQKKWEAERDEAKENQKPFKKKSPKQTVRANLLQYLEKAGAWDNYEPRDIRLREIQDDEKEALGTIISDNNDEIYKENWEVIEGCDTYEDLTEGAENERFTLPGIITAVDEKETKREGKKMGVITIEHEGDSVDFVVFPKDWKRYSFAWRERTPGLFTLSQGKRGAKFGSLEIMK